MSIYAYAWIASILYGLETILIKAINKHSIKNPWLFNYVWALSTLVFIIPLAIFNMAGFPKSWDIILYSSLVNSIFSIMFIFALSKIDVSVFSPLFNFKTAFSVILGFMFLGEVLAPTKMIYMFLIFVAGFFVSLDENISAKSFFNRSVFILLISAFLYAVFSVLINMAIESNGYWTSNLWVGIFSCIFLTLSYPLFRGGISIRDEISVIKPIYLLPLLIIALAEAIGNLASIKAYSENVGISSAIISIPFSMLMAVGLSFVWPKLLEKHTVKIYAIRGASAFVMIYSALQLSV